MGGRRNLTKGYMLPLKPGPALERGVFELSWSLQRRRSLVDIGDLTDVACQVPSDSVHHAGATCELVGPGRFTAHELGAVIERAVGKPIQVREISADTYLNRWVGDADPSLQLRLAGLQFVACR